MATTAQTPGAGEDNDLYRKLMALRLQAAEFADEAADNRPLNKPVSEYEASERGKAGAYYEAAQLAKAHIAALPAATRASDFSLSELARMLDGKRAIHLELASSATDAADQRYWQGTAAAFEQARDILLGAEDVAAALAAQAPKQGGTGAGWKLVPEECTPEMMRAFWLAGPYPEKPFAPGYRAMLAAAPNPPAGEAVGGEARLQEALVAVRDRIANPVHGGIDDTFWMTPTVTVVDYIDAVLVAAPTPQPDDLAGLSAGAEEPGHWGEAVLMGSPGNRRLASALVNAYRSGRLVPAPAAPQARDSHGAPDGRPD